MQGLTFIYHNPSSRPEAGLCQYSELNKHSNKQILSWAATLLETSAPSTGVCGYVWCVGRWVTQVPAACLAFQ